jgi:hypothetical protein
MPMTLSVADLKELQRKHKAGEPIELEDAKDGFTIVIHKHEMAELMRGTPADGRAEVEDLEDGAILMRIVDPIKARIRLDEIQVRADRISFNTNLSVFLRKPIELMLRAKGDKRIMMDGKRIIARIPPRAQQWGELRAMRISSDKIEVEGILKKTPQQRNAV